MSADPRVRSVQRWKRNVGVGQWLHTSRELELIGTIQLHIRSPRQNFGR